LAVNHWGQLGTWLFHVCNDPQRLADELTSLCEGRTERAPKSTCRYPVTPGGSDIGPFATRSGGPLSANRRIDPDLTRFGPQPDVGPGWTSG
jgi:hypothetical protein